MKILIVSHEYPPIGGGGANACMNLAREYGNAGHKVVILSAWYEGLEGTETWDNISIIRVHAKRKHLEHCGFAEMMDFLIKAIPVAKKLEKTNRFDICHVFFAIPSGPIAYILKRKYDLPYVIRFGGGDIPGFQERFAKVYKLIGPFEKQIWKYADALVANSSGLKKLAEDFYNKREILVIPNGVDNRAFSDEETAEYVESKCNDNVIRLLFVSRLIERKGLQFLLPQLNDIRHQCENLGRSVRLSVVGDGPYREELVRIAKESNVFDIVEFHGQRSKSELPNYYSQAEIFVFPSKKEGMPNVVLEAMSYGLPVVMTPCEGSEELIRDNGYAVPSDEFSKSIVKLVCDDALREQMGRRSKEIVEESFQWRQVANQYIKIFTKILSEYFIFEKEKV